MKTTNNLSMEEIRQSVINTIPFIIEGKQPIELQVFDNVKELEQSLKADIKEKFTIKLKVFVCELLEKFNIEKWRINELTKVISDMIDNTYNLFGNTVWNEDFFEYDNFYDWELLYMTFDELKIDIPYDEFIEDIVLDIETEMSEEIVLYDFVYDILKEKMIFS